MMKFLHPLGIIDRKQRKSAERQRRLQERDVSQDGGEVERDSIKTKITG